MENNKIQQFHNNPTTEGYSDFLNDFNTSIIIGVLTALQNYNFFERQVFKYLNMVNINTLNSNFQTAYHYQV